MNRFSEPRFYDGIFAEANRSNEAAGRSFHVPEDKPVNIIWPIIAVCIVAFVLAGSLAA